ncbi:hypothetical protein LshimejAT787_0310810 [Lyophyllum shimeji]|uniref:Uncharacterized protein n=1 Tax=Lyophyllum shimeji TaxID=47721 RepID=A0A9P3PJV5_LYOSH|nr:hypothetical protein LshimejAT787_0310810 [Lyophyllum shimeji]
MDHSSDIDSAKVPPDAILRATNEAKKEGVFAGLTSGLAAAIIGQRLLGFNTNKTILSGTLTALLAGYLFTQAFTETHLAQLRQPARPLGPSNPDDSLASSAQQSDIK